jgi:hypothetical protein
VFYVFDEFTYIAPKLYKPLPENMDKKQDNNNQPE